MSFFFSSLVLRRPLPESDEAPRSPGLCRVGVPGKPLEPDQSFRWVFFFFLIRTNFSKCWCTLRGVPFHRGLLLVTDFALVLVLPLLGGTLCSFLNFPYLVVEVV